MAKKKAATKKLKIETVMIAKHEIDFGTGKLYYSIQPGGTILLTELMQALQNAAMVVPLQQIIARIKAGSTIF